MKFTDLDKHIPYMTGKKHTKETVIWKHGFDQEITALSPGKYQDVTNGGDFVVVVTDGKAGWDKHKFRHVDLFEDFERKAQKNLEDTQRLLTETSWCCTNNGDPDELKDRASLPGLYEGTIHRTAQALALAEWRRYAVHEANGGGRWLFLKFLAGIVNGKWTAADAAQHEKSGMPGLRKLEHFAKRDA